MTRMAETTRSAHRPLAWLLCLSQVAMITGVTGCREAGAGRNDGGSASFAAPGSTAGGPDLGQIAYDTLHANLTSTGTTAQVTALESHKSEFIDAVNRTLPTGSTNTLWPTIQKFLPLVDDDTIPNGVKDVRNILADLAADPAVCQALADIQNSTGGKGAIDQGDMVRMLSRLLAYKDIETLARSSSDFCKANPTMLDKLLGILSRRLKTVTASSLSGAPMPGMNDLADELLRDADMSGFGDVGAPGWTVLLDKNNNPRVTVDTATKKVLPPFVDDGSGTAAIDKDGDQVDAQGKKITIKPFGTDGTRDSYGRAIVPGGRTLFVYIDVKRTTLGQLLILSGEAMKKDLANDTFLLIDKLIDRQTHTDPQTGEQYQTFVTPSPFCDVGASGMEVIRRTPLPQVLQGIAALDRSNPAQFEDTVSSLVIAIDKARKSGFSSAGQASMIDDLLPLLDAACKPQGNNTTAMRALLTEFTKAQAQLHDLPLGFARMMKYNDYSKLIPAGPGRPSVMQRLLDVMRRSDQCSAPFLGNLAELYIDTMAGNNKSILGIKLDVHSMNKLLKISFLRSLLCSQLNADDCQVLQDFTDSGALDAFVPIAKAFSDRHETRLLVDIMLKMGDHYATAMAPNEPAVVKLLESGAVEKLFVALDHMNSVQIPGTQMVVADALADTIAAMVDMSKPIVDRHGRSYSCLLKMVKQPLDDLQALAVKRGEQARWDRIVQNAMDVFFAVYKDPFTGQEKIRASGLIHGIGEILDFVAKQIPTDPATRWTWCDQKMKDVDALMGDRDLCALIDIFKTVKSSPQAKVFDDAIGNLLTPAKTVQQDALGAIAALLAGIIQVKPKNTAPVNNQSIATLANFVGRELDPAAGKVKNLLVMMRKLVETDDSLFLLQVIRNAFDMGPNGNLDAPIMVIMKTLDDVKKAGPQTAGSATGASVKSSLDKTISFLDDGQNGLPAIFQRIKGRVR